MDRLIKRFDAVKDNDLMLCPDRGVAHQEDMEVSCQYDKAYFNHYASLPSDIANSLNRGRIDFVNKHCRGKAIDIGIGCGAFVAGRPNTYGYDVNPYAVEWLKSRKLFSNDFRSFEAYTFWDVLEHVPEPEIYLKRVGKGAHVFVSIPIFSDLRSIRKSKHYKPGEHLYYFTEVGFIQWMSLYGFRLVDRSDHEIRSGRDSIISFAFCRDLPDYSDMLAEYIWLHDSRHYGASASMYLPYLTPIIQKENPQSILDYGCGRSDLVSHYYLDGRRQLLRFDPAISEYRSMPETPVDIVLCCDVMEHIRMADVDRIFSEIKSKSSRVFFVISTKLARANLRSGQNAHVTLLKKSEWINWIKDVFGMADVIPTEWDHVLMVKT